MTTNTKQLEPSLSDLVVNEDCQLRRINSSPCLGQEHDETDVMARLAQCSACLKDLPPSAQRSPSSSLKSSLKKEGYLHDHDGNAPREGVRFGNVAVHEHPYLLGCNPEARKGPPTTLSWCPAQSTTYTVDQAQADRQPRNALFLRTASTERKARLLDTGLYTTQDLEAAIAEAQEIQASRKASAKETSDLKRIIAEAKQKRQEQAEKTKAERRKRGFRRLFSM